jgi:hypothetical protein
MNSYNAKYKRGLFWKTVKGIVADGYIEGTNVRFFILEDGTRIEIPMSKCIVIFDKKRSESVKQENKS